MSDKYNQLTNRHIAKLLTKLAPFDMPEIAQAEIKRQMHFLKNDLISEKHAVSESNYHEENFNR